MSGLVTSVNEEQEREEEEGGNINMSYGFTHVKGRITI